MKRLVWTFINLLRRGTKSFSAYERRVLDAVTSELDEGAKRRWMARIDAINLVQRLNGAREVNCYSMLGGRPSMDGASRIVDVEGEFKFATVVVGGATGTTNTVDVWLVDGVLFSLEFKEPTEHADPLLITEIRVDLTSFSRVLQPRVT